APAPAPAALSGAPGDADEDDGQDERDDDEAWRALLDLGPISAEPHRECRDDGDVRDGERPALPGRGRRAEAVAFWFEPRRHRSARYFHAVAFDDGVGEELFAHLAHLRFGGGGVEVAVELDFDALADARVVYGA